MRKETFALALAFFLIGTLCYAEQPLKIEEALFYLNGVSVIEKGVLPLQAGKNFIGFVPASVKKKNLSVALNCENARLIGIDLEPPDETDQLKEIKEKLSKLKAKKQKLERERNFLERLIFNLTKTEFTGPRSYSMVLKEYAKLSEMLSGVIFEENSLNSEIQKLEGKLKKYKFFKALYLIVDGSDQCEIALKYTADLGSWRPFYRLEYDENRVSLTLMAKIEQKSPEDWSEVTVSLTSATPEKNITLPRISPLVLYVSQAPKIARMLEAKPSRGETFFYYELPSTVNLRSGEEKIFVLKTWKWKLSAERIAVPRESPHVFLKARLKRPKEPLIDAEVNIISDNYIVGRTSLSSALSGEYLEFPLGMDNEIEIERKLLSQRFERKWGDRLVVYKKYRISIYNDHDKSAELKIFEPLPVSGDSRVKVEIIDIQPNPVRIDKNNIALWIVKLKPKEKKFIEYSFKVEYPAKAQLNTNF